jgi:nitrous oxide reductase
MPSSFATCGPALARTPSYRQQAQRRRLLAVCAVVGLALASGLIGSLIQPAANPAAAPVADGPFSYFPAQ